MMLDSGLLFEPPCALERFSSRNILLHCDNTVKIYLSYDARQHTCDRPALKCLSHTVRYLYNIKLGHFHNSMLENKFTCTPLSVTSSTRPKALLEIS